MILGKIHKKVDTKKKALKLIYDPVCLLRLLYSKYGDIEEDFNCLYINQLLYETSSHYTIIYKEFEFYQNFDEYLKRWYTLRESVNRMPKINDYYKNYHKFFCKPNFNDFSIANIMQNYGDEKAELYYKDNFGVSNSDKDEDITRKNNSMSLSSLDNITNNKTIFNEKNRFLIDKNEKSINYSMTMSLNNTTLNSINNKNKNLASSKRTNDSFDQIVDNIVHYKKKKKKKDKKNKRNKSNKNNKNENEIKKLNNYQQKKCNSKKGHTENKSRKTNKISTKDQKIKNYNSNNIVKVRQFIGDNNALTSILKVFNSPKNIIKRHSQKTKFEEYNNNNQLSKKNSTNVHHQRNKTYTLNNYSGVISLYDNGVQNLTNSKFLKKTPSQNKTNFKSIITLKDLMEKQNSKKKNKTFDSMSFLKNQMISASSNIKIYNRFKSNQNICGMSCKNSNYIGSKFNLVKNVKNINFDKLKNKKPTSYNYYQNILNKIMPKKDIYRGINNNNYKNITSFGQNNLNINNNTSHSPQRNKSISPINTNKDNKLYNNNDIKNRNKLAKNQINNYNINFNNVFLTSSKPNSYVIDNNNNNNMTCKNSNNSHVYSSINVIKNMNNNSINNNLNNNNFIYSNILDHENKTNKNLYVMNLKNIYNVSRNKNNILINNNPLTQTEGHHSKIQNNYNIIHIQKNNYNINKIKEAKLVIDKMNYRSGIEDSAYILNNNLNNISKSQHRNKSKRRIKESQKISNEINNFIKKTQINFNLRNKNKNIELFKANKLLNTGEDIDKKKLKNNKSFNCSKNTFSSSSVSRRKNKSKINKNVMYKATNGNSKKVSSLTSQKNIKSKYKRKIK